MLMWAPILTGWHFHPLPVIAIGTLAISYAAAAQRWNGADHRWPARHSLCWLLGLVFYALAVLSPIDVYSHALFSAKALQVTLLLMVVPQLWALGLPGTLLRQTVGEPSRELLSSILHARVSQYVTHPVVGLVVLIGLPMALYGSSWYVAGLNNRMIDAMTQFALLGGGFHYFWSRLQRDPVPRLFPQVVTVSIMLFDIALFSIVPLALMVSPSIIGIDFYTAAPRPAWAPSLEADQDLGGGILWALGDMASIPFLLIALTQWARRDQQEAEEIDRALDELDVARPTEPNGDAAPSSLWWENDALLAEHLHWRRRS